MSYRDWLFYTLVQEGIIDESQNPETLTKDDLLTTTDLDAVDLETFYSEYCEYCEANELEPSGDLEDE